MMPRSALIIEDNRSVGDILHKVFKMQAVASHIINNGKEAMDYLKTATPTIIFLDMGLEDFNANLLLEFIYAQSHLTHATVIILSNNRALSKIGLERIDFILRKPLDIQQLNYTISQIVPQQDSNQFIRNIGT